MYWSTTVSRRAVLTTCAAVVGSGLAGCTMAGRQRTTDGGGTAATGIYIHNETDADKSVTLTATDSDGKTWIDVTVSVAAHNNFKVNPHSFDYQQTEHKVSLLPVGNDYTVDVDIDGGGSNSLDWNDVKQGLSPLRILILDPSDIIFTVDIDPKILGPEKTSNS